MGIAWCRGTAREGPAWPFLSFLWDKPGLKEVGIIFWLKIKNIFRLYLASPKDTESHMCGFYQYPREESGPCPPKPRLKAHSSTDEKIIWSPQLSVALFNLINRGERGWRLYCLHCLPPQYKKPIGLVLRSQSYPFSLFPTYHPKMRRNINLVLFSYCSVKLSQSSNALLKIQLESYLPSTN